MCLQDFWEYLFSTSKTWGMYVYEQVSSFNKYKLTDAILASVWRFYPCAIYYRTGWMCRHRPLLLCTLTSSLVDAGWCRWERQPLTMVYLYSTVWPYLAMSWLHWRYLLSHRYGIHTCLAMVSVSLTLCLNKIFLFLDLLHPWTKLHRNMPYISWALKSISSLT